MDYHSLKLTKDWVFPKETILNLGWIGPGLRKSVTWRTLVDSGTATTGRLPLYSYSGNSVTQVIKVGAKGVPGKKGPLVVRPFPRTREPVFKRIRPGAVY